MTVNPTPPLNIAFLLARAQRASRTAMDAALQAHGLSLAQYTVLRRLEDDPGLSGADLARRMHITAQTVNRLIAALEHAGLLERFPDANHNRILRARLTDAGRHAAALARRTVAAVEERMLADLTLEERAQLFDLLRRCLDALELPARREAAAGWQPRIIELDGEEGQAAQS